MSVVVNMVRRGAYLDSVALMRISRAVAALSGVEEAGLMIGTPANRAILSDAGVLGPEGEAASPGDLIIAVRARDRVAADAAAAEAGRLLDERRQGQGQGEGAAWQPRTLRAALQASPDASLALISVPGDFATAEARKALRRGLDVMIFSDNVPVAEEAALKQEARALGRLVMGPDCGTAIIAGVPLAFANVVPRGDIGIIGASGTGIQEVSCLIAHAGRGISHAIGTGGRDLKAEVGAITTLSAIDLLDADSATRHIVMISKPPAPEVARMVLERIARASKPVTICMLGASDLHLPPNAHHAGTLEEAAGLAVAATGGTRMPVAPMSVTLGRSAPRPLIRGLFAGGTLCTEAQLVLIEQGLPVTSNVPVREAVALADGAGFHRLIDLGDDEFTRGRPHPMIEPAVRDAALADAIADTEVGVILMDFVLGTGGHMDPAGHVAARLAGCRDRDDGPLIVASVTGTEGDPQRRSAQVRALEAAGVMVAHSNAAAARLAVALVTALVP